MSLDDKNAQEPPGRDRDRDELERQLVGAMEKVEACWSTLNRAHVWRGDPLLLHHDNGLTSDDMNTAIVEALGRLRAASALLRRARGNGAADDDQ